MKLRVPYETTEDHGVFLDLEVADRNIAARFVPKEPAPVPDLEGAVAYAVEHPVSGRKLSEILSGAKTLAIITENQFRQAPVKEALRVLLAAARTAGAKPCIVVGCGKVPAPGEDVLVEKFGADVVKSGVEIFCNDVSKPENYVFRGVTRAGTPLWVHRAVAVADVIVTLGTTQATLWGYGGSGMIIPAVAGNDTIETNHVMALAPDCLPGNNACRMQDDKYEAARLAGVSMGVNMIVSNAGAVTHVNAGEFVPAHKLAVAAYDETYRFSTKPLGHEKADIVITGSSAPTNHLFFHTSWAIVNCLPAVKPGGTILFASPCPGVGDWPGFALWDMIADFMPPTPENREKALHAFFDRSRELWAGCIWYKVYEAMFHARCHIVTDPKNLDHARRIGFNVYDDIGKAYADALARHGADARVAFVPYGRYTVLDG